MTQTRLTSWQRRRLREQLRTTLDARLYRRTLAMLEHDLGRSTTDIARLLRVSRQSVYNWLGAYTPTRRPSALADAMRSGRPALLQEHEDLLQGLLRLSPQELGLPHACWSAPLLCETLEAAIAQRERVSCRTVRRALQRLDFVWKRPRYALEPDPEAEKKTAHPPSDQRLAPTQRRAGRR
jgi:transposase